jgi:membrane protein involved in colicin uptake
VSAAEPIDASRQWAAAIIERVTGSWYKPEAQAYQGLTSCRVEIDLLPDGAVV